MLHLTISVSEHTNVLTSGRKDYYFLKLSQLMNSYFFWFVSLVRAGSCLMSFPTLVST